MAFEIKQINPTFVSKRINNEVDSPYLLIRAELNRVGNLEFTIYSEGEIFEGFIDLVEGEGMDDVVFVSRRNATSKEKSKYEV